PKLARPTSPKGPSTVEFRGNESGILGGGLDDTGEPVAGEEVSKPGADGELADFDIPFLRAGARRFASGGAGIWFYLTVGVVIAGLITTVFFVFRRRRRTMRMIEAEAF
ncbi:MAG: hypothetical protein ACRD1T_01005, partial [Acidimicrobiia bacterium]